MTTLYYVIQHGSFKGFHDVPKNEAQFWVDTMIYTATKQGSANDYLTTSERAEKIQKELK